MPIQACFLALGAALTASPSPLFQEWLLPPYRAEQALIDVLTALTASPEGLGFCLVAASVLFGMLRGRPEQPARARKTPCTGDTV